MTGLNTRDSGAATGTGDRSRPRAALPALCLTQIVSWGIVYYAFPVLNPKITAATGWSAGATTAAFSLGLEGDDGRSPEPESPRAHQHPRQNQCALAA